MIEVINGDCVEKLKDLPDNSIDSVVTDPPYGLSFMGKHWDYDVPNVDVWKEVYRVLKPGGYLLSFGGTRTYHRMACAIEDAGFEIRDMIEWLYGSGFPKSLDIGRAVDKLQGNEREVVGEKKLWGHNAGSGAGSFSKNEYEGVTGVTRIEPLTKGTSEWEGWGTALKPAHEPICMARKPLSEKTVAGNVLKHGTGGINIDGCRVKTEELLIGGQYSGGERQKANCYGKHKNLPKESFTQPTGRFPANVIHDGSEAVVREFPITASGKMKQHIDGGSFNVYGKMYPRDVETIGDSGSAARFFYCAKASKSERDYGLDDFTLKVKQTQMRGNNGTGKKNFKGGFQDQIMKNDHPTVKPVALMRYLCRMVTPKGGTVLDPFMGSGTTGIAAKVEGYSFIGIEREEEYCKIAEARIAAWEEEKVMDTQQKLF